MLCHTCIRNSFLSKEVSKPLIWNLSWFHPTKGRAWERKWTCSSLLRMPWSFWPTSCRVIWWLTKQYWAVPGKNERSIFKLQQTCGFWYFGWPLLASCLGHCSLHSIHPYQKADPGRHLKKRATRELQDVAGYANLDGLGWKGSLERLQQSKKMQVSFAFISMVHSW